MISTKFRLLLLAVLLAACEAPQEIIGHVVAVADGDTVTVLTGADQRIRVRLAQIDAPERGQPFSRLSTQSLREMVHNQQVRVVVEDIDQYGRTVGRIYRFMDNGELDANAEQVRRGMAWVYRRYASDESLYALEQEAREARRGLWRQRNPVPPWQHRHASRETEN